MESIGSVVLATLIAVLVGRIMENGWKMGYQDCAFLCTIIIIVSLYYVFYTAVNKVTVVIIV